MGALLYAGTEYEVNDNVLLTLQLAHRAAVRSGESFYVSLFDGLEHTVELALGPGIPVGFSTAGGTADIECARRWADLAMRNESISITCLDLLCDCVLQPEAASAD